MKSLHQKYVNNLVASANVRGGVCRINEHTTKIMIEEVTKVEFTSLYANLLVKLYKDGVFQRIKPFTSVIPIDPQVIEKVEYFLKNRCIIKAESMDKYTEYKTWINSIYNRELRPRVYYLFEIYYQYLSQYYNDIQELNKYTWLHTDTDQMHFAGSINDINIPDIGLPFSKEKVDLLYIESEKKYIEYTNDFKVRGYSKRHRPEDIITMMRQRIRERKLDIIGI